jgi:hypothetical protein
MQMVQTTSETYSYRQSKVRGNAQQYNNQEKPHEINVECL